MESYEELEVFKEAHKLVLEVYRLARVFPEEEKFRLVTRVLQILSKRLCS